MLQLATKGQHAIHDSVVKKNTKKSIIDYENLEAELRDEKAQETELDVLNYLAKKLINDLSKSVPTEADVSGHKFLGRYYSRSNKK